MKNIVLVGGCFDLIHYGHIRFLTDAKSYGTRLVVLLESDERVKDLKGSTRPIHTQQQRKAMLEAIKTVDEIILVPDKVSDTYYQEIVQTIHPAVIAVTEGDPIIEKKQTQAQTIGAKLIVIPKIHTPSTSQLAKLLELE